MSGGWGGGRPVLFPAGGRRLSLRWRRLLAAGLRHCRLHPGGLRARWRRKLRREGGGASDRLPGSWDSPLAGARGDPPGILRRRAPHPGQGLWSERGRGLEGVGRRLERGKDGDPIPWA